MMNNNQIPDKEICGPNANFSKVSLFLNKYQVIPDSEETNKIKGKLLKEKWTWFERKWSKASNDTGIGNPIKSTKEKGERYFQDVTNKVSELIVELCDLDINNQYETKN